MSVSPLFRSSTTQYVASLLIEPKDLPMPLQGMIRKGSEISYTSLFLLFSSSRICDFINSKYFSAVIRCSLSSSR